MATASHVFLQQGALRGSLQAPYVDPYGVIHRGDKTYTIEVQDAAKTVSIDRLKPAHVFHVDTESASTLASPSDLTTLSGRRVPFPDYLGMQRSKRDDGVVDTAASSPT